MDFPSREEARIYAQLQAKNARPTADPTAVREVPEEPAAGPVDAARFRVLKVGFEKDVYDRRGIRNLIRTGAIAEQDKVRVDDGEPQRAIDVPYLKSLLELRKTARGTPPACCRTHTERIAYFQCHDTGRPLCEECAPERKFGATIIRVCQHCGGTAADLVPAVGDKSR